MVCVSTLLEARDVEGSISISNEGTKVDKISETSKSAGIGGISESESEYTPLNTRAAAIMAMSTASAAQTILNWTEVA